MKNLNQTGRFLALGQLPSFKSPNPLWDCWPLWDYALMAGQHDVTESINWVPRKKTSARLEKDAPRNAVSALIKFGRPHPFLRNT